MAWPPSAVTGRMTTKHALGETDKMMTERSRWMSVGKAEGLAVRVGSRTDASTKPPVTVVRVGEASPSDDGALARRSRKAQ